jgi:carbamate kinase
VRILVALGGNALMQRGDTPDADVQERNVAVAAAAIAPLARDHEVIVTHGNGPQVGVLALESASDRSLRHPFPLDALGAETQGLIGYWLVQELQHHLPDREVAALVTRVVVDPADPAFGNPTKFVGPVYAEHEARELAERHGWVIAPDGDHWRRVVASPAPLRVLECEVVDRLVTAGVLVVCAGGGGVPVAEGPDGTLRGVEAVVDKDLTAAVLAEELHADVLVVLTDVEGVIRGWGTPTARPIGTTGPAALRALELPAGSMGPKVEAVCRFVERTGATAVIGALAEAPAVLRGARGTVVRPDPGPVRPDPGPVRPDG